MGLARLAACGALALALLGGALAETPRRADAARMMNELMSGKAQVGGPFTLTDQHGKRRSLSDFRGKLCCCISATPSARTSAPRTCSRWGA